MSEPVGIFSGVASGIDWRAMIDQIMTLERRPADILEGRVADEQARKSAYAEFRSLVNAVESASSKLRDGSAFDQVTTQTSGLSANGGTLLIASAAHGTAPGSYDVEILELAAAEKLGGGQFSSTSAALGFSGEFFVNGVRLSVAATDTLVAIRDKINNANSGDDATNVTASILTSGTNVNRLILTSDDAGTDGIALTDTSDGVLGQLGFLDSTTTLKNSTSSGGESDRFSSASTAVSTLLELSGSVGSQSVTIGGQSVSINLDSESLTDIAANINALTGVSATVESNTLSDGTTEYYLDVRDTTSFVDMGNTLELLGIVKQGRGSVAHSVEGSVLTDGDASSAATTSSLLTNLWSGGSDASVTAGDTLTITGTRGDGTSVSLTHTIGGSDTIQTLLDEINNSTDGFGYGSRTATATIDVDGQITLTDDTSGDSRMTFSIVAHNENGGSLDFGSFSVENLGRSREIVAGADSTIRINGVTVTRSTNEVTDALDGVRLNLVRAEEGSIATVTVARNSGGATAAAQEFVDAYNDLVTFTKDQLVADPETGEKGALHGDAMLRLTRSQMVNHILSSIEGAASDLATVSIAGLSLQTSGLLSLDSTALEDAFDSQHNDLRRLFMEQGSTSNSELSFVSSNATADAGTYAVNITQAAAQAAVTGSGFSGTYSDTGDSDYVTVADTASGAVAEVQLTNGMTTQQIVDALNTQFDLAVQNVRLSTNALYSDNPPTTAITSATTFSSLYASDGTAANVSADDTISCSGARPDGTLFATTYTITDPATDTIGDFVTHLQQTLGNDVTVSISSGRIRVQDNTAGTTNTSLSLVYGGDGALDFGATALDTAGRFAMAITASASGNEVVLTHDAYGSDSGFNVSFTGDDTSQIGITAQSYAGTDVAGTIGSYAATGSGRQLIGDEDTEVAGMHVAYSGSTTGSIGNVTLTVGTGALIERQLDELLESATGLLDTKETDLGDRISRLEDQIVVVEERLARRRALLIKRFTAMEMLVGQLQAQSAAMGSQISSMFTSSGGNN